MHLLRNASQAVSSGGVITIRSAALVNQVSVEFTDDGRGIAADQLEGLFDMRFSTSSSRIKLGVGLASCRQIVQQHGGKLTVKSAPAEGIHLHGGPAHGAPGAARTGVTAAGVSVDPGRCWCPRSGVAD